MSAREWVGYICGGLMLTAVVVFCVAGLWYILTSDDWPLGVVLIVLILLVGGFLWGIA